MVWFQTISSGKYNAGEVKLASETMLGKVNNHVHLTGSNATPLSHAEVLAVKNAAAKAATAAIKAQQALSEELAKLNGRLAANDNVDAKLQDAFTEMQFQADRRSTEILSIAARMYDLALQDAAAGPGGDPKMKALLSATFSELMPREAILMHGTAEALELMDKQMADKMRPLAEKLDALQARGGAILSNEEIAALDPDMSTMKEALANVRRNGLKLPGKGENERLEVDKSLLDGMEKTLDAAWDKIQNARADMATRVRKEFVGEVIENLSIGKTPEEKALAATRTRLDEAISHAKALKKKNKVIAADDWSNPDTVRNLAKLRNSVTLPSTQGQGIHKASRDSRHVSNFLVRICPSYFRRDYMGDSIPW